MIHKTVEWLRQLAENSLAHVPERQHLVTMGRTEVLAVAAELEKLEADFREEHRLADCLRYYADKFRRIARDSRSDTPEERAWVNCYLMCADYLDSELPGYPQQIGPKIFDMMLCEQDIVILQPDQLYRFTVDPNCENCKRLAEVSIGWRRLSDASANR
jgi:hypothetical protein